MIAQIRQQAQTAAAQFHGTAALVNEVFDRLRAARPEFWHAFTDAVASVELYLDQRDRSLPREHVIALIAEICGADDELIDAEKKFQRKFAHKLGEQRNEN